MIQCLTLQSSSAYNGGTGNVLETPVLSAVSRLCMNQMGKSVTARRYSFSRLLPLFPRILRWNMEEGVDLSIEYCVVSHSRFYFFPSKK